MAEHIFVRIFQKGNATPLGDDHKVKPIPDDVADLKEKLFGDDGDYNSLCFVYDRGDGPPSESDTRLSARDPVPVAVNNEAERGLPPLRVVVPLKSRKRSFEAVSPEVPVEDLAALATALEGDDFDRAWSILERIATGFVGNATEESRNTICPPFMVQSTWAGGTGAKNLTKQLRSQCVAVDSNIEKIVQRELDEAEGRPIDPTDGADARSGRIVGIRLGSGCGKSHLLLEAPKFLAMEGLYITYNLSQALQGDKRHPRKAILLRILLRLAKIPHQTVDKIITAESNVLGSALFGVDIDCLRDLAVWQLDKYRGGKPGVFVGVDEVMALTSEGGLTVAGVRQVLSELSQVATKFFKETTGYLYVFVTSLNEAPFRTASGSELVEWTPMPPDEKAAEEILKYFLNDRSMSDLKPLLIAAAGFHFRSMVYAAEVLGAHNTPSAHSVFCKVYDKWHPKVKGILEEIRTYVESGCMGIQVSKGNVEQYLDNNGAVPPSLICGAFGIMKKGEGSAHTVDTHSPLYKLFNCEFAYTNASKQLEQFGTSYDRFRAQRELPVLSAKVTVVLTEETRKERKWFRSLTYPDDMEISTESWFQTVDKEAKEAVVSATGKPAQKAKEKGTTGKSPKKAKKEKITALTPVGKSPMRGKYYLPGNSSHAYVERAFVAVAEDGHECYVLIQDKVNQDVPKAVNGLNEAGKLIRENGKEVLCILNIIGAGKRATKQDDMKYPFVLVGEHVLSDFYSPHFASVAKFIRERHLIAYEKSQAEK